MAKKTSQKPPKTTAKPAARPESVAMRTVAVPSSLGEGEVRLYDAWKAALPDLVEPPPEALLAEFQWVLVHFPSRRGVVVKGDRLEGLRLLKQIEKGENVLGLLPETLKPSHARAGARARARGQKDEETGEVGEGEKAKKVKRPKLRIKVDASLSFEKALEAAFSPQFLVNEICDVLRAVKPIADKNGSIVGYQEDFMTRTTALFKLVEQSRGRAGEKPPPPAEKKRVTYEQLVGQIQTSPAARLMLRRLIDEADEAAKAKPEATAETPAAGA